MSRLHARPLKYGLVLVSLVLLCLGSACYADFSAAYDVFSYAGHQYALTITGNSGYLSWLAAEQEAVSVGGHLVTVNDAAENEWLAATFDSTYAPAGASSMLNAAWIGLEYGGTGSGYDLNNWQWVSGDDSSYRATRYGSATWGPHMYLHCGSHPWSGTWNLNSLHDNSATYHFRGIIEFDPATVPLPGAVLLGAIGLTGAGWRLRRREV
ncbi:MAG: hypothetical protein JXN61_06680 [Sedimentisphaerales bacterium]|nr:hypothetical protein [Sedimentisphaerales bacterium]